MAVLDSSQFMFEKDPTARASIAAHRPKDLAEKELAVLLVRLGVKDTAPPLTEDARNLLLRYCMEVPLNIAWYEQARAAAEKRREEDLQKYVLAAIVVAAGTLLPGFLGPDHSVVAAQVSAMVGAALFVLRLLASATDRKAQAAAFHKASADLKEALYTFEQAWHRKVTIDGSGALDPELEGALWEALRDARKIAHEERNAYFATLKSPTDIVADTSTGIEALRTGVSAIATARQGVVDAAALAAKPVTDARNNLTVAQGKAAAAAVKVKGLTEAHLEKGDIDTALKERINADAEVANCETLLKALRTRAPLHAL